MNYLAEINDFYDWLETNPVSDSTILLWHALMHVNNKSGWKKEFAVAISTLELKTSLSKSSIVRARNTLKQAGRIDFKSRTGQQSAVYKIIAFHTDTQTVTQSEVVIQDETQSDTQTSVAVHIDTQSDTQKGKKRTVACHSEPIPKHNNLINKVIKILYRENIKLTAQENERLVSELGQKTVDECYNFLSDYKKEKGYKTKDDNLTIRRWVIKAVTEKKQKHGSNTDQKPLTSKAARNEAGFNHILNSLQSDIEADGRGTKNSAA